MKNVVSLSRLLVLAVAAIANGCTTVQTAPPAATIKIAKKFQTEKSSPVSIEVVATTEQDNCRSMELPNGKDRKLSSLISSSLQLSQLLAGVEQSGPKLKIHISRFQVQCATAPAFIEIEGSVQLGQLEPRSIRARQVFPFSLLFTSIAPDSVHAFDLAVEQFMIEAIN
jgi:ABC-type uncharacterized transport system auxiliary subunit